MLNTTFNLLREHAVYAEGYRKLARALGGVRKYGRDTPIPLLRVLESNGLDDALWCLRAVPPEEEAVRDRIARLFACRCVRETPLADGRKVWDLLTDERSRAAVVVAERFATGDATEEGLRAARGAAWEAARGAAWEAARGAAWEAARGAAWEAARGAAWEAARGAAWEAARGAQSVFLKQALAGRKEGA